MYVKQDGSIHLFYLFKFFLKLFLRAVSGLQQD